MSKLDETSATIDAIRLEIENLKVAQANAAKAVENAKAVMRSQSEQSSSTTNNKTSTSNDDNKEPEYGDSSYWNDRYQKEGSDPSSGALDGEIDLYEWYIDYPEFYKLLMNDLSRLNKGQQKSSSIVHAGCGNSSLCEDLYKDGACVTYHIASHSVLHRIVSYHIALSCIVSHRIASHCRTYRILSHRITYCIASHHILSHRIAYCITLHCIASYPIIPIVSHRMASYRIVSYRIASYHIALHCIALHRIALHRIVSHRIASHRIASRNASHRTV
jgi:hypothetical protein